MQRSRTDPMLLRYPAGSTCGSGAFGKGMLGIGGMDILENPGVAGDFKEVWDDMEAASARLEEFFRDPPEVIDADLSLREKRPILAIGSPLMQVGYARECVWNPSKNVALLYKNVLPFLVLYVLV